MKKRCLLLALVIVLCLAAFVSCTCAHRDANDDTKCDKCEESYIDGEDICNHRDANDDSKCDRCDVEYSDEVEICYHRDADDNGECDKCGAVFDDGSDCQHRDLDDNSKCDKCNTIYADGIDCEHRDANDDNLCDKCNASFDDGEDGKVYLIEWDSPAALKLKATENSNNRELPSTCARYLAGELTQEEQNTDYHQVDIMVGRRNTSAYETINVTLTYDYFPEGDTYSWSKCINVISAEVIGGSSGRADMYCNFIYDMVATALKGSFANLYSTVNGTNYFEFAKPKYEDAGTGYMYEYMKSLTISEKKMYCLASDYFTDMVRAFLVVPVNVTLLNSIEVDPECNEVGYDPDIATKYNSDRTGDGIFDIDDFYNLVWDGQWNYSILADFSRDIYESADLTERSDNGNLSDTIGFAISSSSETAISGLLYTSSVSFFEREWDNSLDDYRYWYPETNTELYDFCDAITELFTLNKGVITVDNSQCMGFGPDALQAIRNQFASNKVLFGGVICLGSLEYDEYKEMSRGDGNSIYGILPVPLYRDVNPETGEPDKYLTQIHNVGRIGAISSTTEKFSQCSAFLDYQSLNSTEILNEYYNYKLSFDVVGGDSRNTEMLQYIRYNVRSSFDKTLEDAIGIYFSTIDPESNGNRWHAIIMNSGFVFDGEAMLQKYADIYKTKQWHLYDHLRLYGPLPE